MNTPAKLEKKPTTSPARRYNHLTSTMVAIQRHKTEIQDKARTTTAHPVMSTRYAPLATAWRGSPGGMPVILWW